jgi:anthranilate synthase component 1
MEIIDDLEPEPRGLYGGGVGYYSWTGDTDFAIVIRTATVEHGEARSASETRAETEGNREQGTGPYTDDRADDLDRITVQAGAGIVADSDPASEYYETEKKMDGVLTALDRIADQSVEADAQPDPAGDVGEPEEVSR